MDFITLVIITVILFYIASHLIGNPDQVEGCKIHSWSYDERGFLRCITCKKRPLE